MELIKDREKRFTNLADGSRVAYYVTGSGPGVILIHGFGEDHSVWNLQVNHLCNKYKVVCIDLPGTGESFHPGKGLSMTDFAQAIRSIIVAEAVKSFVLIGHSMGGYASLAFAELYPEGIMGLGLFHSSCFADSEEKKITRRKNAGFIRDNGVQKFLSTAIPGLFFDTDAHQTDINTLIERGSAINFEVLASYQVAMGERQDHSQVISNAPFPVLIIAGRHDAAVPLQHSLQQASLAKLTDFHILSQSGHMGMLEQTAESNNILSNFLLVAHSR